MEVVWLQHPRSKRKILAAKTAPKEYVAAGYRLTGSYQETPGSMLDLIPILCERIGDSSFTAPSSGGCEHMVGRVQNYFDLRSGDPVTYSRLADAYGVTVEPEA